MKMKQCKCGEADQSKLVVDGHGRIENRCHDCQRIYLNQRRNENKQILVDYKGGECEDCKYNKYLAVLCFHHLDPETKDSNCRHICGWGIKRAKAEVDKCQLLCQNCHTFTHYGEDYEDMVSKYIRTTELFLCKYCNEQDEDKMEKNCRTICKECKIKVDIQRKRKKKKLLVEHMGGCCSKCKDVYHQSVYEFHHLDPSKKDDDFDTITQWPLDRAKKELENCIMVCRNCHGEIHHPNECVPA